MYISEQFGMLQRLHHSDDIRAKTYIRIILGHPIYSVLTLARKPCFATFAGVGGGVGATPPPWRFQTKRRRASRKRPADCSRRVLAIGGIIFGPRSIFDPVMAGQRSNFRKFHVFFQLHESMASKLSIVAA